MSRQRTPGSGSRIIITVLLVLAAVAARDSSATPKTSTCKYKRANLGNVESGTENACVEVTLLDGTTGYKWDGNAELTCSCGVELEDRQTGSCPNECPKSLAFQVAFQPKLPFDSVKVFSTKAECEESAKKFTDALCKHNPPVLVSTDPEPKWIPLAKACNRDQKINCAVDKPVGCLETDVGENVCCEIGADGNVSGDAVCMVSNDATPEDKPPTSEEPPPAGEDLP